MYMEYHSLYILVGVDIPKILVVLDTITKQLIREAEQVTERLTIKRNNGDCVLKAESCCYGWYSFDVQESLRKEGTEILKKAIYKLAEYEIAEEEGRMVVLPFKLGTTLFLPRRGEVLPLRVTGTRYYENRTEIDLVYIGSNENYRFLSTHPTVQYVEKEYFLTREEAEKALKEMEKDDTAN